MLDFHRFSRTVEKPITYYRCTCDCGKEKVICGTSLTCGDTQSCGCFHVERTRHACLTHGMTGTKEYRAWNHMHERCYDVNNVKYPIYGGRGIVVCERWHKTNPLGFENFLKDVGLAPRPSSTIDRIDSNKGYSPDNCRWTDWVTQNNNRSNSVRVDVNGVFLTRNEVARKFGVHIRCIESYRTRGYSYAQIINYYKNKKYRTQSIGSVIGGERGR
jgi:hypothetical protein